MPDTISDYARSYDLDYFDAAQALYWYCVDYHGGQFSDLYAIQCRLGYRPGVLERGPEHNSTAAAVYADLESGRINASDLETWIDANYRRSE